uniref:Uncharacterized protein n=1 Tax=Arundo donax TaxID=35708 RepID=A0A0A9AA78_ARUDO
MDQVKLYLLFIFLRFLFTQY